MPLLDDVLTPVPGENPAGQDLRYAPVYDKIKEARREDDDLSQGAWQHERKVADFALVIKLAHEVLTNQTKDLQVAAWLAEALIKRNGFSGLADGLSIFHGLLENFWEHLYPELEDGDAEFRASPLEWAGSKFDFLIKSVPLCAAGYDFYKYTESRQVGYEDQATSKDQKTAREAALKAGKLPAEDFDKSFAHTPKAFYAQAETNLDLCLERLQALDQLCDEKFGDVAPSFARLRTALEEVRRAVRALLNKKREIEPDPVEEAPPEQVEIHASADAGAGGETQAVAVSSSGGFAAVMVQAAEEPASRKETISSVVAAAAFLRKSEPYSPAPYLMLRGLRWGELRAAIHSKDLAKLEAPPTDVRRMIKKLALDGKWKELLEAAENVMALPCSRGWLDLQRLVVDACVNLGSDYQYIAMAIRSELRGLVRDVPAILNLTLMDDTPAANPDTQTWLRQLAEEPEAATPQAAAALTLNGEHSAGWQKNFVDSYDLAIQALRSGHEQKAFEILHSEIQRQRSGRGRFERRLQLVQLCVSAGKEALMQPILEDLIAAVETHKLEDWEDREKMAAALATILRASKKIQGDAKEKQKMFERICRLDPVQALSVG
jgi:type VI secretion system protein ImpA